MVLDLINCFDIEKKNSRCLSHSCLLLGWFGFFFGTVVAVVLQGTANRNSFTQDSCSLSSAAMSSYIRVSIIHSWYYREKDDAWEWAKNWWSHWNTLVLFWLQTTPECRWVNNRTRNSARGCCLWLKTVKSQISLEWKWIQGDEEIKAGPVLNWIGRVKCFYWLWNKKKKKKSKFQLRLVVESTYLKANTAFVLTEELCWIQS